MCSWWWGSVAEDAAALLLGAPLLLWLSARLWHLYILARYSDPHFTTDRPLPNGSMGLPWLGETLEFLYKRADFYRERRIRYGPVYKTHLFGKPTIRVSGFENARVICNGEGNLVESCWPSSVVQLMGVSVSHCTDVRLHRKRRTAIAPAFANVALQSYVSRIEEICCRQLETWQHKRDVLLFPECKKLAFAVAADLLLGIPCDQDRSQQLATLFGHITDNFFSFPIEIPVVGFRKGMMARRQVLGILDDILTDQIAGTDDVAPGQQDASPSTRKTALRLLIDAMERPAGAGGCSMDGAASGGLSREEVVTAAVELLLAGHENTTSALCNLLRQLALHPGVVDEVRRELSSHGLLDLEPNGGEKPGLPITLDRLNQLRYLNGVVNEILRLCPPVGAGFRKAIKSFVIDVSGSSITTVCSNASKVFNRYLGV